jgi:hypothetical protein
MIFDDSAYVLQNASITDEAQKYYYLQIGVPKMDTWCGGDDLSLDRPDPWTDRRAKHHLVIA